MTINWNSVGVSTSVSSQVPEAIAQRVFDGAQTITAELGRGEKKTAGFTDNGGCKLASKAKLNVKKDDMSPSHAFVVYAWTIATLETALGPVNHIVPPAVKLWYDKLEQRVAAEKEEAEKLAKEAAAKAK